MADMEIKSWFYDDVNDVRGKRRNDDELDRAVNSFYETYGIPSAQLITKDTKSYERSLNDQERLS